MTLSLCLLYFYQLTGQDKCPVTIVFQAKNVSGEMNGKEGSIELDNSIIIYRQESNEIKICCSVDDVYKITYEFDKVIDPEAKTTIFKYLCLNRNGFTFHVFILLGKDGHMVMIEDVKKGTKLYYQVDML